MTANSGANLKDKKVNAKSSFLRQFACASAYAAGTPVIAPTKIAPPVIMIELRRNLGNSDANTCL